MNSTSMMVQACPSGLRLVADFLATVLCRVHQNELLPLLLESFGNKAYYANRKRIHIGISKSSASLLTVYNPTWLQRLIDRWTDGDLQMSHATVRVPPPPGVALNLTVPSKATTWGSGGLEIPIPGRRGFD